MEPEPINWHRPAWRRWPKAAWIKGEGPIALVAYCKVPTVTLWTKRSEAEKRKRWIDEFACSGSYHRDHHIVDLRPVRCCSSATLHKKVHLGKCGIPFCRRDARYAVRAVESLLGLKAKAPGVYSKCPLICEGHAEVYQLLRPGKKAKMIHLISLRQDEARSYTE